MQTCFAETNRQGLAVLGDHPFFDCCYHDWSHWKSCARANFVGVLISFFGENSAGHFKTDPKVPQRALCVISTSKSRLAASFVRGKIAVLGECREALADCRSSAPRPVQAGDMEGPLLD